MATKTIVTQEQTIEKVSAKALEDFLNEFMEASEEWGFEVREYDRSLNLTTVDVTCHNYRLNDSKQLVFAASVFSTTQSVGIDVLCYFEDFESVNHYAAFMG